MSEESKYAIDNSKWEARCDLINTDMKLIDRGDMVPILLWNIKKGTESPEYRKKYWNNLTNMYAPLSDSPIKIGIQSKLPQSVQTNLATIVTRYEAGHQEMFDSDADFYSVTIRAKGAAGLTAYADGAAYAAHDGKNMRNRYVGYYNNHDNKVADTIQWNGKLDKAGLPILTYPPLPVKEVEG